jgi:hypothetical protein
VAAPVQKLRANLQSTLPLAPQGLRTPTFIGRSICRVKPLTPEFTASQCSWCRISAVLGCTGLYFWRGAGAQRGCVASGPVPTARESPG